MAEYTQDQYNEALMKVINTLSISTIVSYPGVMEILREELNNDVIDILEDQKF